MIFSPPPCQCFHLIDTSYHGAFFPKFEKPTKTKDVKKMAKTKNTHAFQNDIKHYDKIRDILRFLYMYGSSSKEELVEKKLAKSISSFYDTKQRIENYIDGEYLQEHKSSEKGSGKKFRFMYDPFVCPVNYLAETYQNCSYVIDDVIFFFCLMQLFSGPNTPQNPYEYYDFEETDSSGSLAMDRAYTLTELISQMSIIYERNQEILSDLNGIDVNELHSELLFTLPKVRARVNELVSLGILISPTKDTFQLSQDIFENCSSNELADLQLMSQFFYNCSFLTIPGFYLSATIEEYSQSNFVPESDKFFIKQENPVFFYKNQRLQSVIDDDVTWTLINSIHNLNVVHYSYRTKDSEILEFDILPMKIVIDKQYGRQYFFGYNYSEHKFFMPRISSITDISINKKIKEPQKYEFIPYYSGKEHIHSIYNQIYSEYIDNVWNIAFGESTTEVLIHFNFPIDDYAKYLDRLKRTMHNGQITELGNGNIAFTVVTQNELELVPWIRSFGKFAVVDQNKNPNLATKIKNDWKEAIQQYGII